MTEYTIQKALWYSVRSGATCAMPNWTPPGWWECDLAVVTGNRYFTEYEIKLSLADLRADARKRNQAWTGKTIVTEDRREYVYRKYTKHGLMRESHTAGPSRFYLVVPAELANSEAIPAWAGIIVARNLGPRWADTKVVRAPKQLHRHKVDQGFLNRMRHAAYHRFWERYARDGEPPNLELQNMDSQQ